MVSVHGRLDPDVREADEPADRGWLLETVRSALHDRERCRERAVDRCRAGMCLPGEATEDPDLPELLGDGPVEAWANLP